MHAFSLVQRSDAQAAAVLAAQAGSKFIAGGTDLLQLARNNVETPSRLIDLEPLPLSEISVDGNRLRLGAMARMSDVAAHPAVKDRWPVISQALLASASPQVRNAGTMGGNLLQRTRCGYFRDTGSACNKREPGTGCSALRGESRMHAILGVSDHCIAAHPSDLAVALVALDAVVELLAPDGSSRHVRLREFHRLPGDTPQHETIMVAGELVTAILVESAPASRSVYVKVRDRASFEFAVVAAAVALDVAGNTIRRARIAAGGVGTKPWHLPAVEAALHGRPISAATLRDAAECAGQGARTTPQNAFKIPLLQRTVLRALQTATA